MNFWFHFSLLVLGWLYGFSSFPLSPTLHLVWMDIAGPSPLSSRTLPPVLPGSEEDSSSDTVKVDLAGLYHPFIPRRQEENPWLT